MNNIFISFVLPCYNVSNYISFCIDSIFKIAENRCFEIVCVNDCSTDNTREIILKYARVHHQIKLIDHVKNLKQGGAMNTGIANSKGKYIWIVAPDDFICGDVDHIFKILEKFSLELVLFNYIKVDESGSYIRKKKLVDNSYNVCKGIEILEKGGGDLLSNYDLSVACRIYLRSYIFSNNFKFIENTAMTDLEFSIRTLAFAEKVITSEFAIYCYRYNPSSVSNNWDFKGDKIFQLSLIIGYSLIKLSVDIQNVNLDYSLLLRKGAIWRINSFTIPIIKSKYKELLIFQGLVKSVINFDDYNVYLKWYNKLLLSNTVLMSIVWVITFFKRIKHL